MRLERFTAVLLVAVFCGCGRGTDGPTAPPSGDVAGRAEPAANAPKPPPPPPPPEAIEAAERLTSPKPAEPEVVREKAVAGVGRKGRGYSSGGLITTPISTYFHLKQQIAFDIQVKPALNLYKAQYGEAPKSHEQFMEKIIRANRIELPELPAGHRYVYDPQQEQLMVERPAGR